MTGSLRVAAYLALFGGVGILFVLVTMVFGWLFRPKNAYDEKLQIYECGEQPIGSSFVQFDLRFYVIALVFIIFDVEVAFLFPWATVFGKANLLTQDRAAVVAAVDAQDTVTGAASLTPLPESPSTGLLRELGVANPVVTAADSETVANGARQLLQLAIAEVLVFFMILMLGFAYVWRLGALDWITTMTPASKARTIRASVETKLSPAESSLSA